MTQEIVNVSASYPALIEKAVEGGNLDIVAKMMDLQDRHDAKQAKQAFDIAMSEFKSNAPTIIKNKQGHNYKYADLAQVVAKATPILSQYGLSASWETDSTPKDSTVQVTCKICHIDGHCDSVTLRELYENSGSKNRIQSLASAVTYLERYTFMAITGLAAGGEDDDGYQAAPQQTEIPLIQSLIMMGDSVGIHLLHVKSQASDEAMIQLGHEIKSGIGDGLKAKISERCTAMNTSGKKLLSELELALAGCDKEGVQEVVETMTNPTKKVLAELFPDMSSDIKGVLDGSIVPVEVAA